MCDLKGFQHIRYTSKGCHNNHAHSKIYMYIHDKNPCYKLYTHTEHCKKLTIKNKYTNKMHLYEPSNCTYCIHRAGNQVHSAQIQNIVHNALPFKKAPDFLAIDIFLSYIWCLFKQRRYHLLH